MRRRTCFCTAQNCAMRHHLYFVSRSITCVVFPIDFRFQDACILPSRDLNPNIFPAELTTTISTQDQSKLVEPTHPPTLSRSKVKTIPRLKSHATSTMKRLPKRPTRQKPARSALRKMTPRKSLPRKPKSDAAARRRSQVPHLLRLRERRRRNLSRRKMLLEALR